MNTSNMKKILLLLILIFTLIFIFFKFSPNFVDLIVQQDQVIKTFIKDNHQTSIIISTFVIILATIIMCPMSPFIILIGFFHDFYYAFFITIIGETIGAIIVFIYVKWFFQSYFRSKFGPFFQNLEIKFNKNAIFYLLALRVVGGTPFFIENILPAIFNMRILPFIFGTFFGVMPWAYIIVGIGSSFQLVLNAKINGVDAIMSSSFVLYSFICAIFIVFSIFFKKFLKGQ